MSAQLPEPLTPADCDLRDFPHTPLFRARLFGSSFHAQASDSEWRAGVTLWLKSWDQVPAGSLPDNEIELCRLAELARDLKAWKKLRDGALRGWVLCTDGRLYHPVVAEGVNTAIEAKIKQRLKTAKARIAALEKHLAQAQSDDDKARITDEIRKLQQMLSQGLSQTVRQGPREGEGKEKGLDTGANAPGGKPPMSPDEIIFGYGLSMLVNAGTPDKNARSFLGGLRKAHGDAALIDKLRECAKTKALQPLEWLAAALPPAGMKAAPNKQEALEQRNRTVADAWAAEGA
ncbi:hypothetical protein GCM10007320_08890 [Pseudorhodoferax aquiterrae]|uniref:DUF1376 domain-containing protein n=1 Tax=Pseudorhodoferax aquiterrae TaxID=747304 RepID=A0ABQ3FWI5_9BURK|nr:DUF1376 domain-containing protein [Pseudorhodoferax aquiterrae]GHC72782.1 hypothetical protein GCM10007320_08890 [Pseudorhodoferax aquiterrae]